MNIMKCRLCPWGDRQKEGWTSLHTKRMVLSLTVKEIGLCTRLQLHIIGTCSHQISPKLSLRVSLMFLCFAFHHLDLIVLEEQFLVWITVYMVLSKLQRVSKVFSTEFMIAEGFTAVIDLQRVWTEHQGSSLLIWTSEVSFRVSLVCWWRSPLY